MYVVEEAVGDSATNLSTAAGALPPDGGVQHELERELECVRLEYARQVLWGEEYCSEGSGSDGYEGGAEEAFWAKADGGDGVDTALAESSLVGVMCSVGLCSQR